MAVKASLILKAVQRCGCLMFDDPFAVRDYIRSFGDKALEVVIRPFKETRSVRQNRYYWSVVIGMIADHTGMAENDVHEAMKQMFLSRVVMVPVEGGVREVVVSDSSSIIKTHEFSEYVAKIQQWASEELNIDIPDPERVEVVQ